MENKNKYIMISAFALFGLIGPVISNMQFRLIGVLGYAGFFPVACLFIGTQIVKNGKRSQGGIL